MKQIEITTRVLDDISVVDEKLTKLGFQVIRTFIINDLYLCPNLTGLTKLNIDKYLKQCVLLRQIETETEIINKITYKNKVFQNGVTLSEEKIDVEIDDTEKAKSLFQALNFQELIHVTNQSVVYKKDNWELAFQNVTGLGLLLEYEHDDDFTGQDEKTILKTKHEMLQKVKALGIQITDDFDVKKARELVLKKLSNIDKNY